MGSWTPISSLGEILVCSPCTALQSEPWDTKVGGKDNENIRKRDMFLQILYVSYFNRIYWTKPQVLALS